MSWGTHTHTHTSVFLLSHRRVNFVDVCAWWLPVETPPTLTNESARLMSPEHDFIKAQLFHCTAHSTAEPDVQLKLSFLSRVHDEPHLSHLFWMLSIVLSLLTF